LNDAIPNGSNFKVIPQDINWETIYTFYIYISVSGGGTGYDGPHTLNVGCSDISGVTFTGPTDILIGTNDTS